MINLYRVTLDLSFIKDVVDFEQAQDLLLTHDGTQPVCYVLAESKADAKTAFEPSNDWFGPDALIVHKVENLFQVPAAEMDKPVLYGMGKGTPMLRGGGIQRTLTARLAWKLADEDRERRLKAKQKPAKAG